MKQNIKNKTRIYTKVYSKHDKTGYEINSHNGSDELFIWDQFNDIIKRPYWKFIWKHRFW